MSKINEIEETKKLEEMLSVAAKKLRDDRAKDHAKRSLWHLYKNASERNFIQLLSENADGMNERVGSAELVGKLGDNITLKIYSISENLEKENPIGFEVERAENRFFLFDGWVSVIL